MTGSEFLLDGCRKIDDSASGRGTKRECYGSERCDSSQTIFNDENFKKAHENIKKVREACLECIRNTGDKEAVDAYYLTHLFDAPYSFDSFMLFIEHGRPQGQQFWLPRRKKLLFLAQALEDLEYDRLDELFLSMPPRVGKALANDTPVLTSGGWKKHGDLVVGDEVIGIDGKFKKVVAVHPKCQLDVQVEFTNGEKILCHENHEWMFYDRRCAKNRILETKEIERHKVDLGTPKKRGHRYLLQEPNKERVTGEEKDLTMDPYSLGVWLGDGTNRNPTVCGSVDDFKIIEKMMSKSKERVTWVTRHKTTGVMYYGFGFRKKLNALNMCHSRKTLEKHIPDEYFTASIEQRLELLAGLLDTDGTLRRKERRYTFSTAEERLKDDFIRLISTFGWRACVVYYEPGVSSSGVKSVRGTYSISFNPDLFIPCALERKQLKEFSKKRKVAVKSVTRVSPTEGNCITVEGDGMYLVGDTLIPTHNSTLIMFFVLWVILRDSERANLYSSYTEGVVETFYNGLLEVLNDPYTYDWQTVFPTQRVASTNSKDCTLNIDRKKRYPSITCRSLWGALNGRCDVSKGEKYYGYLFGDDMISGIEEALSKDRLDHAYLQVTNNYLARDATGTAKKLWIGTRWALTDPIGRRIELLENDGKFKDYRWKIVNVPALDENDESNFDYDYGVGTNTEAYHRIRAGFERNNDMPSWYAQYMGTPVDRVGAVFEPEELRYYNGELPDADPDRIFMAVDPAWGGGDFVAAPVGFQYGDDIYIHDVVYNNGDKTVTWPLIVNAIERNGVQAVRVEATRATSSYTEGINDRLKERGIHVNVQNSIKNWTGTGKDQRILDKAPDIRQKMIFRENGCRSKEYQTFMNNLFSFRFLQGRAALKQSDDAPDSLAQMVDMAYFTAQPIVIMKRLF